MARKSNKTAHVLNLLSGQQDSGAEPEKEVQQPQNSKTEAETTTADTEPEQAAAEAPQTPAPAPVKAQAAAPEVPSNISIIDNGAKEADPVAERIHEELLKELEKEEGAAGPMAVPASEMPESEAEPAPEPEALKAGADSVPSMEAVKAESAPAVEPPKTEAAVSSSAEAPKAETAASSVPEAPKAETAASPVPEAPKAEPPSASIMEQPQEEVLELSPEPAAEPEPPAEPEPDYVMLNVMQRVVEDKIIYFMKQFEVCTCDRCRADTIALTLSGLPAKYRIVDRHAVDPLVSYYTSRLISQVTVEALKACTQVKDNPRH